MTDLRQRASTRRACLRGLAGLAASAFAAPAHAGFCRDTLLPAEPAAHRGPPLGAASPRVIWGTSIEAPGLYDPRLVEAVVAEAPKCLAIGSGLKFGNLFPTESFEPAPDRWSECDDIVALATKIGVPVRGDCLSWNDWLPDWVVALARERPEDLHAHFDAQFRSVFAHFAALAARDPRVDLRWCGLVNEPFNPWIQRRGKVGWRTGAWLDAFGMADDGVPQYIHEAFALGARHAAPGIALFVNEAHCDNDHYGPLMRPAMLDLLDALQRRKHRVDAVGLECHLVPQWMTTPDAPDWRPFVGFLRDLARRGVEVYITELDVNDCALQDVSARDARVGHYLRSFVEASLSVPAVTMVTNWDFSDRYSWLRSSGVYPAFSKWAQCVDDPPCPRPTIYDEAMRPKSARRDLFEALVRAR